MVEVESASLAALVDRKIADAAAVRRGRGLLEGTR